MITKERRLVNEEPMDTWKQSMRKADNRRRVPFVVPAGIGIRSCLTLLGMISVEWPLTNAVSAHMMGLL